MLKNQRGITLVALVITIVVLIILATVSITLALDPDNGIIGGAKQAVEDTKAKDEEITQRLDALEDLVKEYAS